MSDTEGLTVLVVDDELLARQRLQDLLRDAEGVSRVLTADSGPAGVEAILEVEPDLVFLDMQMPGMSGLQVVKRVGPANMPTTVFVTAHDQYAVEAFEVAALDYLLKPFDDDRFQQALRRARRHLQLEQVGDAAERLVSLFERRDAQERQAATARHTPGRIAVETGGTVHVLALDEITYISAAGPYAELHTPARTHLIRETMRSLEERLGPQGFVRIHRSSIVRLDRIESLHRGAGGDHTLRLDDGTELSVSRARLSHLERRLGVER